MDARHIMSGGMRGLDMANNLVEGHRRGVEQQRIVGRMGDHGFRHQRAGIQTDRAAGDDVAPADCQQIRITRPRAYKPNRHLVFSSSLACLPA